MLANARRYQIAAFCVMVSSFITILRNVSARKFSATISRILQLLRSRRYLSPARSASTALAMAIPQQEATKVLPIRGQDAALVNTFFIRQRELRVFEFQAE